MDPVTGKPFVIEEEGVPLEVWDDGSVRVGGTRGTLDVVIGAYNNGEPIAQIADDYGQLPREVIAAVIGYYLRHREAVDEYIREGERIAEETWRKIMSLPGQAEHIERIRSRVAAHRAALAEPNAQPAH
jgi:uncharacterized protein (DUF433 family)